MILHSKKRTKVREVCLIEFGGSFLKGEGEMGSHLLVVIFDDIAMIKTV